MTRCVCKVYARNFFQGTVFIKFISMIRTHYCVFRSNFSSRKCGSTMWTPIIHCYKISRFCLPEYIFLFPDGRFIRCVFFNGFGFTNNIPIQTGNNYLWDNNLWFLFYRHFYYRLLESWKNKCICCYCKSDY